MFEAVPIFSTVYAQYYATVYRYFCACFDKNAAEDLTQSVFTSLWRQMQKTGFLEPDNWRAWIFRAAVNQKNDFLRIKQRDGIKSAILDEADTDGADQAESSILRLSVQSAMRSLAPTDREVLTLKQLDFSSEETGELLGISASAARSRLQKAKAHFQAALLERGVEV